MEMTTRDLILEETRRQIAEHGLDATTIRGVARRAAVDPALVRHYFHTRQELIDEATELDLDIRRMVRVVVHGSPKLAGRRLVGTVLAVWDSPEAGLVPMARLAAALTDQNAAALARTDLIEQFLGEVITRLGADQPRLRAQLIAAQLLGLALFRYLVSEPVLASATAPGLTAVLGDAVGCYLTEPL
ncbi:TetR family transcriptional regulator [Catellatospora sp. NPDC049609]|uniref:TetR/AcrR family transcriptional regulator n=1 Tax=Catellatospora sp. NPDC049609 TaxID=3155505 RepID=UPI0034309A64